MLLGDVHLSAFHENRGAPTTVFQGAPKEAGHRRRQVPGVVVLQHPLLCFRFVHFRWTDCTLEWQSSNNLRKNRGKRPVGLGLTLLPVHFVEPAAAPTTPVTGVFVHSDYDALRCHASETEVATGSAAKDVNLGAREPVANAFGLHRRPKLSLPPPPLQPPHFSVSTSLGSPTRPSQGAGRPSRVQRIAH